MARPAMLHQQAAAGWREGAIAGVIGGAAYTVFVEVVNVATNGAQAILHPLRQIAAIVLGPRALQTDYNAVAIVAAGAVVHFAIAALFGIALAAGLTRRMSSNASAGIIAGMIAGLALYALNVFVVFPAAFPWFLGNDRITQSLGHALFGAITGAWLFRSVASSRQRLPSS